MILGHLSLLVENADSFQEILGLSVRNLTAKILTTLIQGETTCFGHIKGALLFKIAGFLGNFGRPQRLLVHIKIKLAGWAGHLHIVLVLGLSEAKSERSRLVVVDVV